MSDSLIEQLKVRHQELQYDAVAIRGRIEELGELIVMLEKRRGGRPKAAHLKSVSVTGGENDRPAGVAGSLFEAPTDGPEAA